MVPSAPRSSARSRGRPLVRLGEGPLSLESLLALARGEAEAALSEDPAVRERLAAGLDAFEQGRERGETIYGVTTGVGASVGNRVPEGLQESLPEHLLRFHGCGTGRILDEEEAAAVVAVRAASLATGWSAVRPELLEQLCALLNRRCLPRIPAEGSVGASGDLTPLSYLAALLVGEREATFEGRVLPAADALREAGLEPMRLRPKESLALMNGTSVMTGLGLLAWERSVALARLACGATALASAATRGSPGHFDARLFEAKPHPGAQRAAAWIRAHLPQEGAEPARLQDRYSLRCAPHVVGVLLEAAEHAERVLAIEASSANDNPLVDPESGEALHGGNFYGGHVGFVLDGLKTAVASVADLLDRQLPLLCDPRTSAGLPAELVGAPGEEAVVNHGMKAMQIGASALAAEAQKLTMPATAFSRSTESHNQDKVSMGTIAARDALRVLELAETVGAIALLAAAQATDLRAEADGDRAPRLGGAGRALHEALRKHVPVLREDRRQDGDIERVRALHREGALPYAGEGAPAA